MTQRKQKGQSRQNFKKSNPTGQKLTDIQKQAVKMRCIDSMKVQDIAATLGVDRTTLWRWSQSKAYRQEWNRLVKAHVKEYRNRMGWNPRKEKAAWRDRVRQLESKVHAEAEKMDGSDTRAFDKAWKEYHDCLFGAIKGDIKR